MTYELDDIQKKIVKRLKKSNIDNQVTTNELLKLTGINDGSMLRATKINPMRIKKEYPIVSSKRGYWWATSKDELNQSAARIKNHGLAEIEVAEAIENSRLISVKDALKEAA